MNKTRPIVYTFLCVVALVLGFSLLATIQALKIQKATEIIGEVTETIGEAEKSGDIASLKILEDQQKIILQEIESLTQLPVIPSSKNASLQKTNIQQLQSLLPRLQVNINNIKALDLANEYAISARELRRKVEQNPRTIDPLCEWIKSERTWSKAVVTLQSIDPSTASGKIAQEKLGDYISNYEATKRRRELTEYDTVNWAYDFSCQL
jgi:hypothetical protein